MGDINDILKDIDRRNAAHVDQMATRRQQLERDLANLERRAEDNTAAQVSEKAKEAQRRDKAIANAEHLGGKDRAERNLEKTMRGLKEVTLPETKHGAVEELTKVFNRVHDAKAEVRRYS